MTYNTNSLLTYNTFHDVGLLSNQSIFYPRASIAAAMRGAMREAMGKAETDTETMPDTDTDPADVASVMVVRALTVT